MATKERRINVRVATRIRPLNATERAAGCTSIVKAEPAKCSVSCKGKTYPGFDKVYDVDTTQKQIYNDLVAPQVHKILDGYNCTLFAYGQTGTGKTYTMEGGRPGSQSSVDDPDTGVIPRAVEHIFTELEKSSSEEYTVRVSYMELYNEELFDLLAPNCDDRERLRIFDDPNKKGSVIVCGLEEIPVRTRQEVYQILKKGADNRTTAATLMNLNSSRSHSIFTISVCLRENNDSGEELVKQGKLNLVDLAGSENVGRSGAEGKRAKEAGNINQSLLTLGRVITALTTGSGIHIPYRESKLTRILQDSLGGSTITSIIATLSPASSNYEESVSTLEYASRAKNIRNHPECNQKLSRKALLKEYNEEIEKLRRDLRNAREKNGIFLSKESYDGMEAELSEKNQLVQDLESRLEDCCVKLQRFVEDMHMMDENYREIYMRNQDLSDRLTTRVSELETTKRELQEAQLKIAAYDSAYKEMHVAALSLRSGFNETRGVALDQQMDLTDWWRRDEQLLGIAASNEALVSATNAKIGDVESALRTFIAHNTDLILQTIQLRSTNENGEVSKLAAACTAIDDTVAGVKRTLDTFSTECTELRTSFEQSIVSLLHESLERKKSKTAEVDKEMSTLSSAVQSKLDAMSQTLQELATAHGRLGEQMQTMVQHRKNECARWTARENELVNEAKAERDQSFSKINSLIEALISEQKKVQMNAENFQSKLSENSAQFTAASTTLESEQERWISEQNDAISHALLAQNEKVSEASTTLTALENHHSLASQASIVEAEAVCESAKVAVRNVCAAWMEKSESMTSASAEALVAIGSEVQKSVAVGCQLKQIDSEYGQNQEKATLELRDSTVSQLQSIASTSESSLEHWKKYHSTGATPVKEHYKVIEDHEISDVPEQEDLLLRFGINNEARKSTYRTRDSVLEKENIFASPDSLNARKKARLADITEESPIASFSSNASY